MPKPGLLNTGPMMDLITAGVANDFIVFNLDQVADREALLAEVGGDIRAVCTGSHTGVRTDAAILDRLPNLKIIGNFGVGYDTIDIAAARRRGIIITNTPEVLTEEVADTAIGLLLGTIREFYEAEQWLRQGRWPTEGDYRLTAASLRDRSIGIMGMGRIGRAIARRLEAFGRPISYYARTEQPLLPYRYYSDLVAMAGDVDTLIAILPGGPATNNLVNRPVLEALGRRGIFINVARGSVVDEPALIEALKSRTILRAGLDVFVGEPTINPALFALDNVTIVPHIGSASIYTRSRMGQLVVDNLLAFAAGKPPLTPVPETPFKGW
ncbi:MAG TPA: 2-hydroxyacid dehydrogenase [Hyphomicrobiaceae bacterium]|nr:2-hydroxyacid dehydrogenase [Hyphomicrobiaceae bacterium]